MGGVVLKKILSSRVRWYSATSPLASVASLVQFLANLAALGALFLAFHVYKNPTELAGFIQQVSEASRSVEAATKETAVHTADISQSTSDISDDTGELVAALSRAMLIEVKKVRSRDCISTCDILVYVQNITAFRFEDAQFLLFSEDGSLIESHRFGLIAQQSAYDHTFRSVKSLGAICFAYRDSATGIGLFDYRVAGEFSQLTGELQYPEGSSGMSKDGALCG